VKFQKKIVSNVEIEININTKGERNNFFNHTKEILKKDLFIIDFEAWTNEIFNIDNQNRKSKFEQFNFNKIPSFPISIRILKINLANKKNNFSYFKAFMDDKDNFEVIWNEYILDNYSGEQVVLWGGEIEKYFFLHMIPFTYERNMKKLKRFFNFFDFQDIFNSTIFLDRRAMIDIRSGRQKNSSRTINVIKEIMKSIIEETEMSEVAFNNRKREEEFYKVDAYFNKGINNKTYAKTIEKQLKIYSEKEMNSLIYIIKNLERFFSKMNKK